MATIELTELQWWQALYVTFHGRIVEGRNGVRVQFDSGRERWSVQKWEVFDEPTEDGESGGWSDWEELPIGDIPIKPEHQPYHLYNPTVWCGDIRVHPSSCWVMEG